MKKKKSRFQGLCSILIISFLIMTPFFVSCGSSGGGSDSGSQQSNNDGESPSNESVPQDLTSALIIQNERADELFKSFDDLNLYDQNIYNLLKVGDFEEIAKQYTSVLPGLLEEMQNNLDQLGESQQWIDNLSDSPQSLSLPFPMQGDKEYRAGVFVPCVLGVGALAYATYKFISCLEREGYRGNFEKLMTEQDRDAWINDRANWLVAYSSGEMPLEIARQQATDEWRKNSLTSWWPASVRGAQRGIRLGEAFLTHQFKQLMTGLAGVGATVSDKVKTGLKIYKNSQSFEKFLKKASVILSPSKPTKPEDEKLSEKCIPPIKGLEDELDNNVNSNNIVKREMDYRIPSATSSGDGTTNSLYFCQTDNGDCGNLPEGKWDITIFSEGNAPETLENILVSTNDSSVGIEPAFMSLDDVRSNEESSGDSDNDGHYAEGSCNKYPADDCDDSDGNRYPGNIEIKNDGIDQDCDGQDLTDEYVVYYTDNVRCWGAPWLYIGTREKFNSTQYRCNESGGGIDCTQELTKAEIQGGFSTSQEAHDWICPKINGAHFSYWCGQNRAHWLVEGQELDFRLGINCGDLSHVPDVPYPDPHPGM